ILVLLGIAGIGKTYTVRKIMLDWALGELYNQFDYVFHLDCKSLCNELEESTVLDLIFETCPELRQVPGEVIGSTEQVLVLIDGLDAVDLPPDSGPWKDWLGTARLPVPSLLLGLLKKRLYSHSSLLVTVRPTVVEQIKKCNLACQWAEILGFPKERIDDYFQRYFEEPETAAEAVQHVRSNEVLLEMCLIPLICWVVCVLLDSEERPRDSMTYILVNYIYTLLKHHHTDSVSDKEMLQKLCLLARTGIEQRKSCFRMQELPVELADMPKLPDSFVMRILMQQGVRMRSEYSFILPALQCCGGGRQTAGSRILSCFWRSRLMEVGRREQHSGVMRGPALVGVLCLLCCFSVKRCCLSEGSVRALLSLLESRPAITTLDLEGSGLGEAGLWLLCDRLGDMGGGGLQSLGWVELCLVCSCSNCSLPGKSVKKGTASIKSIQPLVSLFQTITFTSQVHFTSVIPGRLLDTGLTAASVPAVCSILRKTAVSALSLGDNPLGDEGVRLLCEALGDPSCQLQRLSLVRCALSDGALPRLQAALESTQTLTELRLGGNDWPESCAEALGRLWMSCRGLKYLE
ncbi:NAL12 protein, partial [Atractosteus spatula]|nr:NAL12 protein [Atractosteus spatula]